MNKQPVWQPSNEFMCRTRLYQWINELGLESYDDLLQRSQNDPEWFWAQVEKKAGVVWDAPYKSVIEDVNEIISPDWFAGGRLNIVESLLDRWAGQPESADRDALLVCSEDGRRTRFSFRELADAVDQCAKGLRALGVAKGDVVALYMPMISEAVIAMLATIRLGAIYAPAFSGYNADALAVRLKASGARFIVTAQGYQRRGNFIDMKGKVDEAIALGTDIEKVIVVGNGSPDFGVQLHKERDLTWESMLAEVTAGSAPLPAEEMASDDPLLLIYTSGTSGKPKGAVHTHAGLPLKAALDIGLCMDVGAGDTLFWITDMGWLTAPVAIFGALMSGAAVAIYDGAPNYPDNDRIWQLVDEFGATHLGFSPTFVRSLMKAEALPHRLPTKLRMFLSTGEPWDDKSWSWLFEKVGNSNLPIINYAGGTEIGGGILVNVLLRPMTASGFNSQVPGMDAVVMNPRGEPVRGEAGELVIRSPWVGMTRSFWNDHDKYCSEYFSRWPGCWVHGDMAIMFDDGSMQIPGRSDDTLNVAGKRLGPSELENVIVSHPDVAEVAVVGVPDDIKGEAAICFVVPRKADHHESLTRELRELVGQKIGKAFMPRNVFFVDALPRTKNGKVLRRVIKNAFVGQDVGDLSALDSYSALEDVARLGEEARAHS